MLTMVASQLGIDPLLWPHYAQRAETRREHLLALQVHLGLTPFGARHGRMVIHALAELALQTDRGMVLATALLDLLRRQHLIVPAVDVIERIGVEALTRANRRLHDILCAALTDPQRQALDALLVIREGSTISSLAWLQQPPGPPNAKHVLAHIERLRAVQSLELPAGLAQEVHQNRLLKLAREGRQMTAQHLRDLTDSRRYATLVAVVLEVRATLIDEIIDLHDRIVGMLFNRAKRRHAERFQQSGSAINDKVRLYSRIGRALLEAKRTGADPFAAIEAIVPWEAFTQSVTDAERLAQPADFDYLPLVADGFTQLRRYSPALLEVLQFKAAPAAHDLLEGVEVLKDLNERQGRKVPENAPLGFVRRRWQNLVCTDDGVERRYYELCIMSELKNSLRSGDISVQDSRQFRDFDAYLIPADRFGTQQEQQTLGLAVDTDVKQFLTNRLALLTEELQRVEDLAARDALPDAALSDRGLKITPLGNDVPDGVEHLMRQAYALLPRLKITELLLEVNGWTNFTRYFVHLKSQETAQDRSLLLSAILADAINLGLTKMAEACPNTTFAKLSWLQAWHVRDETYAAALADLVNAQYRQPFAAYWGDGTTSSSDGQWFRAGGTGQAVSQHNARYGSDPGVSFYTHLSDQYAPFHTKVIAATVRDATHVLDGLLYHESDVRIEEHYTDTAGFTDHVFGLMHLLGFRFAPRIRDLKDKNLYVPGDAKAYPTLAGLVGGSINEKLIRAHWAEILRLAASIRQGTVTASLVLRKLGSYPRQNGLAVALRELGRIERTLFTLDWLQNMELRRRVQVGLNKGEAKNALARAVFFNRLGNCVTAVSRTSATEPLASTW
jgi:TnpA family transposase